MCSAAAASATTASAVSTTATTAVAGILSLHVAKGFARGIRRALTVAADHSGLDVINNRLACSSAGEEIADALDIPINTVKTKIRRAKAMLLKMMDYSDDLL